MANNRGQPATHSQMQRRRLRDQPRQKPGRDEPFTASRRSAIAPQRQPRSRVTLVAPTFLLPCSRRSMPPTTFPRIRLNESSLPDTRARVLPQTGGRRWHGQETSSETREQRFGSDRSFNNRSGAVGNNRHTCKRQSPPRRRSRRSPGRRRHRRGISNHPHRSAATGEPQCRCVAS